MGRPKGSWTGAANPKYNGGRYVTKAGYVFLRRPDHPNADKRGYVREHVLVASEKLGRPIENGEIVHHINEDPSDNRPENLEVMPRGVHHSHHHKGLVKPNSLKALRGKTSDELKAIWATTRAHQRRVNICDHCGSEFTKERLKGRPTHKHQFCDRACFQAFRKANAAKPS